MNIVVVGGGTAGWLVSLYLAAKCPQHNYTTIDSSAIGPIGVGEAATGKFNVMLEECGIDIMDFMRETDALPKYSLRFTDWAKTPGTFDSPFDYSVSHKESLDSRLFLQILNNEPIEYASISGIFSRNEYSTYQLRDNKLINIHTHALQFDATKTAQYLKTQALKYPIRYINDTITDIIIEQQRIRELRTKNGESITADLFIDCSGLSRLLIGRLNPKVNDVSKYIHVDSALLFKLARDTNPKRTMGVSIARNAGWNFEISTRNRMGRGYVHNSNQVTEDQLLDELTRAYGKVEPVRTIKWTPGSLDSGWIGNCIAMGLASSFMEPLQTGSIHDTVIQVKDLVETSLLDTVEQTFDPIVIDSYNRRSRRLFNDYLDFLCVSYAGGREDTEFWRWIKYDQQLTDRAKEILELSKTRLTRELDFDKFMGYGSQGLYNYTLAGLGLYSKDTIKSMFTIHGIDINSLTKRQYSFERAWLQKMSSCLTSVELNQYLAQ